MECKDTSELLLPGVDLQHTKHDIYDKLLYIFLHFIALVIFFHVVNIFSLCLFPFVSFVCLSILPENNHEMVHISIWYVTHQSADVWFQWISVRDETNEKEIDKYENQSEIHIYLIFHILFCQAVMGLVENATKKHSRILSK